MCTYPLPRYLVIQWKENCGHVLEYFWFTKCDMYKEGMYSLLPYSLFCLVSVIIYVVSLSCTTLPPLRHSWFLWNFFFLKCTTGPSEPLAVVRSLFPIMLKPETLCLATYCPSWLIDFWQRLNSNWHCQVRQRFTCSWMLTVKLSCLWKKGVQTPLWLQVHRSVCCATGLTLELSFCSR